MKIDIKRNWCRNLRTAIFINKNKGFLYEHRRKREVM